MNYNDKYFNNVKHDESNLKQIKKIILYFILVTTFSCLMVFFIAVQLINVGIISSITPNTPTEAEVSQGSLIYSVVFVVLTFLFFILIIISLIVNYVYIFLGINKIFEVSKKNIGFQKEIEKIKLYEILSMLTLGLVFPWIIINKTKKLKNKYINNTRSQKKAILFFNKFAFESL